MKCSLLALALGMSFICTAAADDDDEINPGLLPNNSWKWSFGKFLENGDVFLRCYPHEMRVQRPTGELVWSKNVEPTPLNPPHFLPDGTFLFMGKVMRRYDPTTGDVVEEVKVPGVRFEYALPLADGYVASGDDLCIHRASSKQGSIWKQSATHIPRSPITVLRDRVVFAEVMGLSCLSLESGETLWKLKSEDAVGMLTTISPDGPLVCGNLRGRLFTFDRDGKLLSDERDCWKAIGGCVGTVHGGEAFVLSDEGRLWVVDANGKPELQGGFQAAAVTEIRAIDSTRLFVNGVHRVDLIDRRGTLYKSWKSLVPVLDFALSENEKDLLLLNAEGKVDRRDF